MLNSKRGSTFFLFDAVIAAVVFFVAVAIITASLNINSNVEVPRVYGENLMGYYSNTELRNLNINIIDMYISNKTIVNPANTILDQIIVFYERDKDQGEFILNLSESKIPESFGYNVSIVENEVERVVFSKASQNIVPETLTKIRKVGVTKLDNGSIYGPLIVVVSVWY